MGFNIIYINGISKARNLLMSEDVMAAINAVNNLVKVILGSFCKISGVGVDGYKYKGIVIDAKIPH